ncbi:beta strand repeat-containing protein, partial [Furfurilactobacillus curtus]|uniref:beta strand repeat-containing protein n=1 Tax=Furfurilactobacillus curtus TaxID=1746200 RepID=UPI0038B31CD6
GKYKVVLTQAGLEKLAAANDNYDFSHVEPTDVTGQYVINKAQATITGNNLTHIYDGNTVQPTATVTGAVNGETITYDPLTVVGPNVGQYNFTPTASDTAVNKNYNFTYKLGTVTITQAALTQTDVDLTSGSKTYDGQAITDATTVVLPTGLTVPELTQNTDYLVTGTDEQLINAGNYTITLTQAGLDKLAKANTNYDFSHVEPNQVTAQYVVNKATATIAGVTDSKTYDGQTAQPLATITGAVNGEKLVYTIGEVGPNAGTYDFTPTADKDAAVNQNYDITVTGAQYTINKATATITGDNVTHVYDGNTVQPTATITGAVNGETLSYDPLAAVGPNVGHYNFAPTASDVAVNQNYNFVYNPGTVTITPAPLTQADVSLTGGEKTYDAAAITNAATVTLPTGLTVPTLIQGTDYDVTGLDANLKNAGSYTITLTQAGLDKLAAVNDNYDFSQINPALVKTNYVVHKATATLTGNSQTSVFNGQQVTPMATVTGAVDGETITYAPIQAVGPDVGTYYFIPQATNDAVNANYDIKVVAGTIVIQPAIVTAVTLVGSTKTYDGQTITKAASVKLPSGLVAPELMQGVDYTVTGLDPDLTNAGSYTVTLTAAGLAKLMAANSNYDFSKITANQVTTTAVINKANATIAGNDVTHVYDGNTVTPTATVTGAVNGETIRYNALDPVGPNVGQYAFTPTASDNAVNQNYNFTYEAGKVTITQAPLPQAEVALKAGAKIYDGQSINNAATGTLPAGLTAPELTQGIDYLVSGADDRLTNAGTYKVTLTQAGLNKLAAANTNYDFSGIDPAKVTDTYTVSKAHATITGITDSKTYDGGVGQPTAMVTGVVAGEQLVYTIASVGPNAGTYDCVPTVGEDAVNQNYEITVAGGQYTINKANATIAGNDVTHVYDGNTVTPTATVTGAVNGETIQYGALDPVGPNVGQYAFTPTASDNAVNQNYNFTYETGTVTITQAALTQADVTLQGGSKTYNGQSITNAATITLPTGLTVPELTQGTDYLVSGADDRLTNAGTYNVTLTQAGLDKLAEANANYDFSQINPAQVKGHYVVNKALATLTTDSATKVEGNHDPQLTATVTGLIGQDQLNYTVSRVAGENPGQYQLTVAMGDNPNYDVRITNSGSLTILAAVTVNYVDQDGNSIAPDQRQTLTGQVGSTLTITAPTIAGYTLMPGQPTRYVVTNMTGQTVTLQYRQNASVTAHYYLVGTTQQLADSETQTSGVGLAYTTKAKAIAGYTLVATPSNATGLYAGEPTDVNYYYTVDYTVVAQTPDGTALPVGSISGTGTPGEAITGLPTLSGYTLTQTPVVPDQPGQVVAIYTPNTEQLQVNYWLNGSKTAILPSQTVSGPFDSAYQITPLDIPGYTLVSTPANASGTFGLENVDVTYYYELNYTLQPVDENRRPIDGASSVSGHGIPGQSIDLSTLPSIPGYTLVSQTVNVPDQPGVVNVQYVKNSEPIDPGDGGQPVGPSKPVDPNEPVGSNQFGNGGSTTPGQNGSSTVSTGHEVDQIGSTNQEQSDVSQLTNLPKTAARQQINWALLGASFMFSGFAFILLGKPRRKQNRRSTRVSGSRH